MVEPLTSFVLNSLLAAHTCLRVINPVIITSSARPQCKRYVTSDFFTPVPRRGKGKETVTLFTDGTCLEQLSQCQEWVHCSIKHSGWCPIRCRRLLLEELFVSRDRPVKYSLSPIPCHIHPRLRTNSDWPVHNLQRRHASYASEPLRMIAPQSTSSGGRIHCAGTLSPSSSQALSSNSRQEVAERMKRMSNLQHAQFDLDEAWDAYLAAVESNIIFTIPPDDVLNVMEKMAYSVEQRYQDTLNMNAMRVWGRQLLEALQTVETMTASFPNHVRRRHCLLARCLSMMGDSNRALESLHKAQAMTPPTREDCDSIHSYEAIVLSFHRNYDAVHVLDFLVREWNFIEPLLYRMVDERRVLNAAARSLRQSLHRIIASIRDPVELVTLGEGRHGTQQEKRGLILIEFFCEMRRPLLALEVYHALLNQGLYVSADIKYLLVLALTRADNFGVANKIYESLSKSKNRVTRHHLTTGLRLYAHQGDHIQAEHYFNALAEHGWDSGDVKAMYMHAHAARGNFEETLALFDRFYPIGANGERLNSPDRFTFSMIIHGLAIKGDLERINDWLQIMSKAGCQPDVYIYGSILKSFAFRDDMASIAGVVSQMRASGVMPNIVIYNIIMSVLARRGDVEGAEAIYQRAIRERIIPDRQMITTLMNAHVEAGSWEGVIRIFQQFKSASPQQAFGFGTETYNTLLKAYVHIGAPYRLVSRLFDKLKSFHMEPDAYSYSLLIQSACDAGLVNVAKNIFREMDQLPRSDKLVTVYCMTTLMGGYIRTRNLPKAKAVLDEMIQRGIEPTSISIGTLIKTFGIYGRARTYEGLVKAEGFIKSLSPKRADWNKPAPNRRSALEHVYGPLLHAYARERRPEDVERLYQDMLDVGGRPTLGGLTLLLDSYRRASRPESVQQLWPQIFRLGLEYAESSTLVNELDPSKSDPHNSRLKNSILCVPLSIYIDAMSAAGHHAQVAETWHEYASYGFGFDSHNWNHLVIALARAGDIRRSFEIVEKVILPYWKQWQDPEDRLLETISTIEEDSASNKPSVASSDDSNVSEAERRRSKGKVAGSARKLARLNPEIQNALFGSGSDDANVLQPLALLQKITPTRNVWRPHKAVLQLLSMIMARLDSGKLIESIKPDLADAHQDPDPDMVLENQRQAKELLEHIHQNYPETVQILTAYTAMTRRLLGNKEYGKRHTWI